MKIRMTALIIFLIVSVPHVSWGGRTFNFPKKTGKAAASPAKPKTRLSANPAALNDFIKLLGSDCTLKMNRSTTYDYDSIDIMDHATADADKDTGIISLSAEDSGKYDPGGEAMGIIGWNFSCDMPKDYDLAVNVNFKVLKNHLEAHASENGPYGTGCAFNTVVLRVQGEDDFQSVQTVLYRPGAVNIGGFPGGYGSPNTPHQVRFHAEPNKNYRIEVYATTYAAGGCDCTNNHCECGTASSEFQVEVTDFQLSFDVAPFISVDFKRLNVDAQDTYDNYEAHLHNTLDKRYFSQFVKVRISAGGNYDHNMSFVDIDLGGSRALNVSDPGGLSWSINQNGKGIRFQLPRSDTMPLGGKTWYATIQFDPEANPLIQPLNPVFAEKFEGTVYSLETATSLSPERMEPESTITSASSVAFAKYLFPEDYFLWLDEYNEFIRSVAVNSQYTGDSDEQLAVDPKLASKIQEAKQFGKKTASIFDNLYLEVPLRSWYHEKKNFSINGVARNDSQSAKSNDMRSVEVYFDFIPRQQVISDVTFYQGLPDYF